MNVDYDRAPPFPIAEYREMQRAIPAVEHREMRYRDHLETPLDF